MDRNTEIWEKVIHMPLGHFAKPKNVMREYRKGICRQKTWNR